MTVPKPLTADEVAEQKSLGQRCGEEHTLRLIATIEQQREQIKKLRKALEYCAAAPGELNPANQAQFMVAREAIAATEPK